MKRENLYQPFEIILEEVNECPIKNQVFNFFQLVYIISGTGVQYINNNKIDYKAEELFLLSPNGYHYFDVKTTTKFLLIRFNNIYLHNNNWEKETTQKIEFIIHNTNHLPGCIVSRKSDQILAKSIFTAITEEYNNRDLYNCELMAQLINTLIIIVTRNIAMSLPQKVDERTELKILKIIQYIQTYIYEPEKIRIKAISDMFSISLSYLGRYFKKHTGETIQQYISNYKINLIEHRLLHSDMRIKEITQEFGFSDESHFVKFFSKQKGTQPSNYRILFGNNKSE